MGTVLRASVLLFFAILVSCGGTASSSLTSTCNPGAVQPCTCPGGGLGIEVCSAAGTFDACICTAGAGDAGSHHDSGGHRDGAGDTGCTANDEALCEGKCGDLRDECGLLVNCGGCTTGETCGATTPNVCGVGTCVPSCAGVSCDGSDGCGGVCTQECDGGTCGASGQPCCNGSSCSIPLTCTDGICGGECTPTCDGACGQADGCGGICQTGTCATGLSCESGACVCDATGCGGCCDEGGCEDGTDPNACGVGGVACTACATGEVCSSGCESCGEEDEACCTDDVCDSGLTCTDGVCGCTPDCTDAACGGDDGCGGVCTTGTCPTGEACDDGTCECSPISCTGCCDGNICELGTSPAACGIDGESCAICSSPTPLCSDGTCSASSTCTSPEMACATGCCEAYGNSTSLGGTGNYVGTAVLCVRSVVIGEEGILEDIGLFGDSSGVDIVAGLYTSTGTGGGPGTLVAQTGETALAAETMVLPVTDPAVVSATTYWIAVEFSGDATVVESDTVTVPAYCATALGAFSPTLPSTFPADEEYSGREASWFVLVDP